MEWKGENKREEKGRKKGENFFLFGGSTRSADVAVAARSKSLGSVDGKRLRCRGSAAGRTPEEFDRFTCQVKTQRPRITRLYFRDMPSVGRYANRGLLSSIDTLSVDRFRVLLLVRQSRSRAQKKRTARARLFAWRLPVRRRAASRVFQVAAVVVDRRADFYDFYGRSYGDLEEEIAGTRLLEKFRWPKFCQRHRASCESSSARRDFDRSTPPTLYL